MPSTENYSSSLIRSLILRRSIKVLISFSKQSNFLAGYVDYHFAAEEMIMLETHFPRFELHHNGTHNSKSQVTEIAELAMTTGVSKALKLRVSFCRRELASRSHSNQRPRARRVPRTSKWDECDSAAKRQATKNRWTDIERLR